mgnify:CR=1 FL=1
MMQFFRKRRTQPDRAERFLEAPGISKASSVIAQRRSQVIDAMAGATLIAGAGVYLAVQFTPGTPPLSAILAALPASALAMWLSGRFGPSDPPEQIARNTKSHTGRVLRTLL